jgi:hypothetical protein
MQPYVLLPTKRNEENEMMLIPPRDTFLLTEMVHLTHHDSKSAPASPMLDHFHRNRWTNSPEYATEIIGNFIYGKPSLKRRFRHAVLRQFASDCSTVLTGPSGVCLGLVGLRRYPVRRFKQRRLPKEAQWRVRVAKEQR